MSVCELVYSSSFPMSRILSALARAKKKKRWAKIATFALLILTICGLLYLTFSPGPGLRPRLASSSLLTFEKKISAPVFHGITEKGEAYTLSSQQGTQLDEETMVFVSAHGEITKPEGLHTLTADSALYHQRRDTLDLQGNVALTTPQGMVVTPSAITHLKARTAQGTDQVWITAPDLKIQGEGFEASEGHVKILRKAHLIYTPRKSNPRI